MIKIKEREKRTNKQNDRKVRSSVDRHNAACIVTTAGMLVVLFNSIMACLDGIKSVSCFHCHELWPLTDHTTQKSVAPILHIYIWFVIIFSEFECFSDVLQRNIKSALATCIESEWISNVLKKKSYSFYKSKCKMTTNFKYADSA